MMTGATRTEAGTTLVPCPAGELTAREIEVLQLVATGLTNPGIAAHMCLSINTVQTHLRSIFRKINVNTRTAATRFALEHKLDYFTRASHSE